MQAITSNFSPACRKKQESSVRKDEIPFGLQGNVLKHIDDVPSGKKCECVCPGCLGTLVAYKGIYKRHHFGHAAGSSCSTGLETGLHLAAKALLEKHRGMALPAKKAEGSAIDSFGVLHEITEVLEGQWASFDEVIPEQRLGKIIPDLKASITDPQLIKDLELRGNPHLIIEIAVTHFIDDEKSQKIKDQGLYCIEIDLSAMKRTWNWTSLTEALIHGTACKAWTHHPALEAKAQAEAEQMARIVSDDKSRALYYRLKKKAEAQAEADKQWAMAVAQDEQSKAAALLEKERLNAVIQAEIAARMAASKVAEAKRQEEAEKARQLAAEQEVERVALETQRAAEKADLLARQAARVKEQRAEAERQAAAVQAQERKRFDDALHSFEQYLDPVFLANEKKNFADHDSGKKPWLALKELLKIKWGDLPPGMCCDIPFETGFMMHPYVWQAQIVAFFATHKDQAFTADRIFYECTREVAPRIAPDDIVNHIEFASEALCALLPNPEYAVDFYLRFLVRHRLIKKIDDAFQFDKSSDWYPRWRLIG